MFGSFFRYPNKHFYDIKYKITVLLVNISSPSIAISKCALLISGDMARHNDGDLTILNLRELH